MSSITGINFYFAILSHKTNIFYEIDWANVFHGFKYDADVTLAVRDKSKNI